ncbi:hypothetical protein [Streptomyces halobius]|uniref:Uncharacterized protein n=1 Tax=Streptomyces halobius TaxID=2879846 RepID=A0ABY4MHK0_9ACTN|nr:hypothetical protein [Streptomyces halobius]UQA95890.1 hypothetical protein K9S39_32080 [Streptomyces halobius]
MPSMLGRERAHRHQPLLFLHKFADQLSEPARVMYEQIDYVPTQIVTEYLLRFPRCEAPLDALCVVSVQTPQNYQYVRSNKPLARH